MSIRTDVTIDFEVSPRVILIAAPSTVITLQDLVDTCRDLEDELMNLDNDHLVDAAGKEDLGGGVTVGVTVTLKNAKVSFEARSGPTYEQCQISGGNIVALDSLGAQMSPVLPTAFTQVIISQSTSATLIHNESSEDISDAIWASTEGTQLLSNSNFVRQMEGGRWKIENNQLICFKDDNVTEMARFNLMDSSGDPSMTNVFERVRV